METYPSVCVGNKPGDFQRDLWTFSVVIVVSQTDYFSLEALTSLSMVVAIKAGILSQTVILSQTKPIGFGA